MLSTKDFVTNQASALRIQLFGHFIAHVNCVPISFARSRRSAYLLSLLALRHGREVERSWLAGTLWPESTESHAYGTLRTTLNDLRRALGTESHRLQSPSQRMLRLDLVGAEVDVVAFDDAVQRADSDSLARAAELYRGHLLEGCNDEWIFRERETRELMLLQTLETLAQRALEVGDPGKATFYLRRAIAQDNLRESAQRLLMRALIAHGDHAAAVQVYRDLRIHLLRELNADPAPETTALYFDIRQRKQGLAHTSKPAQLAAVRCRHHGTLSHLAGSNANEMKQPIPDAEPEGGAVPITSHYYVERRADNDFHAAISRGDSIVLVKGPRQIGKTSLLARGIDRARSTGAGVVLTDLQKLDAEQLASPASLFRTLAEMIVDQLDLDISLDVAWNPRRGWNVNFERLLRSNILETMTVPLVWGLDEVDQLLSCPYRNVVFGLFRSWHNERALNPEGPWQRLTLAIAYATEAHLLITNLNQSPFNVGTRLVLQDFTVDEVAELSRRYGSPLRHENELSRFFDLVGGHPYLVRRGLDSITALGGDLAALEALSESDDSIFEDHLRRMLTTLQQSDELCNAVRCVLQHKPCPSSESFFRLRSAGVLAGSSSADARLRCGIYAKFLERNLM